MNGRDSNGRFTKGNQIAKGNGGGPGRPPRSREEKFMGIMLNTVTFKDWREIVEKAVSQAKHGNANARKFLADYLLGPPNQRVDVTSGGERIVTDPDINALAEALAAIKPDCGSEGCGSCQSE